MRHRGYLIACFFLAICPAAGADLHRVLVLDAGAQRGADNHRLMLLEIESSKVLAEVKLESPTNLAVADDGSTVAAATYVGLAANRELRLNFYRSADLSLVQTGLLPK